MRKIAAQKDDLRLNRMPGSGVFWHGVILTGVTSADILRKARVDPDAEPTLGEDEEEDED